MFVTPVDSEATLLFVVLRPVDRELRPAAVDVDSALIAVEVEVDSDDTLLLVELNPVDSELIPVDSDATFVAVDVDRLLTAWFVAFNWLPLIASVLVADTWPAATFVIWRSAPGEPMLRTPTGLVPATEYATPPTVTLDTATALPVTAFAPSAIELATFAVAFEPSASALVALAVAPDP